MIQVTRLNNTRMILNSDLIEHIEETPDTVISLTTGQTIRVIESSEEIIARVVSFRRSITSYEGPSVRASVTDCPVAWPQER